MKHEISRLEELLDSLSSAADSAAPVRAVELVDVAGESLDRTGQEAIAADVWHRYLELTGESKFLQTLGSRERRYWWAETAFRAIQVSGYSLETMLLQRVGRHPDRVLFREAAGREASAWTYRQVARRLNNLAGLFCSLETEPRVAIFSDNSVDSACCDLACLVHRIFDTPLNVHFDKPTIGWIFDRLAVNVAVVDTEERLQTLLDLRARTARPFQILVTGSQVHCHDGVRSLGEACAGLNLGRLETLLPPRRTRSLNEVATVMFTSGSTGAPKGIAFTPYHLLSKRFARAAALPCVGNHEVLLCYLPLFHTFGRYLELLGMLYWGGTYVFSGNPSAETLISQMREVRPTGLISIPLRWTQIREFCLESMGEAESPAAQQEVVRDIVGDRLRWGLSAAGHLDPRVFRFFQKHGIDLCSGFGMTEATGGVTMTPPGEYIDETVGIPLPGVRIRFGAQGELEISGPYVARYLEEGGSPDLPPQDPNEDYWLPTGDLFRVREGGHLEIVDRIKDIYKNNRGQTVAPRRVEQKFEGVPGIKRVFLVGDGRDSNVLLIVPDGGDLILPGPETSQYFHRIVASANSDLAPFERVVNFALLDRDFDSEHGELTPKGSYRRKRIEQNFGQVIESLYQADHVELQCGNMRVRIPRWMFRDLGLLESDLSSDAAGIHCGETGLRLTISERGNPRVVQIGNLEYNVTGSVIDLGLFARQPGLWVGNPELAAFCPCKDGWDLPTPLVSANARLPWRGQGDRIEARLDHEPATRDLRLRLIHRLCMHALFGTPADAIAAVTRIGDELRDADVRLTGVIRRRLEALARHPVEELRCLAYRILLTDEPATDYSRSFPAFIESGLTFLNDESIDAIAHAGLAEKGLQALRRRLFSYRAQLRWPASPVTREQFVKVFDLLSNFARRATWYLAPVRAELASWALHHGDPELAAAAEERLSSLTDWFGSLLGAGLRPRLALDKLILDDALPPSVMKRLEKILLDPTFIRQSILLAFDEEDFDPSQIPRAGIWVSRVLSQHQFDLYRAGINLVSGKHFDLLLVVGEEFEGPQVRETIHWLMALADHPSQAHVLPPFGTYRQDLGVMSVGFISDLTMWEKIREYSSAQTARAYFPTPHDWRRLFVRGMAAFLTVWRESGGRIVPGAVSPSNVSVPDADFREGATVLSLTGWTPYESPISLVKPLVRNFFRQTAANYPKTGQQLRVEWIFDSCLEALGPDDGMSFLTRLFVDCEEHAEFEGEEFRSALQEYLRGLRRGPYLPLPLLCAMDRFAEWERSNPDATPAARDEQVDQLYWLYRLDRFHELFRLHLYSRTCFAGSGDPVRAAFDRLLERLFRQPGVPAIHLEELYDLQATLGDTASRETFTRMVFPRTRGTQRLDLRRIGAGDRKQVVVKSEIADARGTAYHVREPLSPAEVGQIYRMLRDSDYRQEISELDQHLVVADDGGQLIGGLTYIPQGSDVVYLRGLVVAAPLKGRGIASALLEDFCARMAARGAHIIKTDFLARHFYSANGFRVDTRWGGLVRHLGTAGR